MHRGAKWALCFIGFALLCGGVIYAGRQHADGVQIDWAVLGGIALIALLSLAIGMEVLWSGFPQAPDSKRRRKAEREPPDYDD